MDRQEALTLLGALPFDRRDYWVVAGAAMLLYGLREQTEDLDLGCSAALADRLEAEGCPCTRSPGGRRAFRWGERVEIFEDWLEDGIVLREGFPLVSMRGLLSMKRRLGRDKDRTDIERLEQALRGGEGT